MPIFDQGYQHWKGALAGRFWRCLAISRQGIREQLKGSISLIRILLIAAWIPALALVTAVALWGMIEQGSETILKMFQHVLPPEVATDPHAYRHAVWTILYSWFFTSELYLIMLLVVLVGPNLVSRDLRYNALTLYFSRPLNRLDYFLGKLGIIAAIVAALAVLPAIGAYILGICFSLDIGVIRDTWRLLPASILYGVIITLSAGTLMLALSSLSRRSLYVGIAWIGLWIISMTVSNAMIGIHRMSIIHGAIREEAAQHYPPPTGNPGEPPQQWMGLPERLAEAARQDWRPLCSYTANLHRLGEALFDTDSAWVEIGRAAEAPRAVMRPFLGRHGPTAAEPSMNDRRLADQIVPQYPWIWSAGVLAALWGISVWILSTRIRSLDRLR
jgi:ABC-2 type transport system permease protein